jgi:cold shock CspA family protein
MGSFSPKGAVGNTLNEGQIVQYEVVSNRGKESAENLKVG